MIPQVLIFDRDNVLNVSSYDPDSPFYYIKHIQKLILKPNVLAAMDIIYAHQIPYIYLATKQRCISKGLATRQEVNDINRRLEEMLGTAFTEIFVEEIENTKKDLFCKIIGKHPDLTREDIILFDDSAIEREVASNTGRIESYDGSDLYRAVCKVFKINNLTVQLICTR